MTVSLAVWWWTSQPSTAPPPPAVLSTAPDPDPTVTVHVAGEVRRPGVVRLPAGSRVIDALTAAGGVTESAVVAAVNLAAPIADGAQIVVPGWGAQPEGIPLGDDPLVSVNTATTADLEDLPGVGPVLAARIVEHRDANGPFATPEDLLDVSGIGESTLARLRPLIRVP